jgi:hypothetical protein
VKENNNNNNLIQFNSIQFFIVYVPNQQPNGQLQTQHSLDAGIYIIDKHKLQASTGGRKIIIIIDSINSVKIFSLRVKE